MILHAKKWKINVCRWFIHRWHVLNLSFSHLTLWTMWPALYASAARYYTNQIQSDCFEFPLKFLLKSELPKMSKNISYIFQIFLSPPPKKKTVMKTFKTEKKSLYHPSNFNSPLPSAPALGRALGQNHCLRCSFLLWVAVRHFPTSFVCLAFRHFGNILVHCAILLQYAVYSQCEAK